MLYDHVSPTYYTYLNILLAWTFINRYKIKKIKNVFQSQHGWHHGNNSMISYSKLEVCVWCSKFRAFLSFMSHNYNMGTLVLEAFFAPPLKAVLIWSKDLVVVVVVVVGTWWWLHTSLETFERWKSEFFSRALLFWSVTLREIHKTQLPSGCKM